jgi:hypothetical protein
MDPSQVSTTRQRSPSRKFMENIDLLLQIIKAEHNDLLGDNDERDAYNGSVYKPRPQLPKPFVFMRSLADIISK